MRLMNIFTQLTRIDNQIPSAANGDKSFLNILISVAKDYVLLRQIAVKYFYCSQVLLLWNRLSKSKATGLDKISARVPCFLDLTSPAFI